MSKNLLILLVKNTQIKSKIFFVKARLKCQKIILNLNYVLFLKLDILYFSTNFTIVCNNFSVCVPIGLIFRSIPQLASSPKLIPHERIVLNYLMC